MRRLVKRFVHWFEASPSTLALWVRAAHDALLGDMPVLAAGTALYAILAIIPTLAAAVGIYSLIADASKIPQNLAALADVLPPAVAQFIANELQRQAARSHGELGFAVATSAVVAIWSARGAARGMIDTLNRAYRVPEQRHPLVKFGITLAISAATLIGMLLFFAAVVALPGILALTHIDSLDFITWLRWPMLFAIVFFAMMLLYRFAPSPRPLGTHQHLWPGALISTALLFGVSLALSLWVSRVTDYNVFYGAFGSVIVTILWFYFSLLSIVLGGFANAELERRDGAPEPAKPTP